MSQDVTTILVIEGAAFVNLRKGPSMTAPVLTVLNEGTEVSVINQRDEWSKVTTAAGISGFIATEFLAKVSYDE